MQFRQLEQMLIDICWEYFDQGKDLYAEKDVSVSYFYIVTMNNLIYADHSTTKKMFRYVNSMDCFIGENI